MADAPAPKSAPDPRNRLARIRTELANERTLLSYGRTALGFAIAGASALLYPVSLDWYQGEGWIFPIYAAVAGLVWIVALRWIDRRKQAVDQAASAPTGTEPATPMI